MEYYQSTTPNIIIVVLIRYLCLSFFTLLMSRMLTITIPVSSRKAQPITIPAITIIEFPLSAITLSGVISSVENQDYNALYMYTYMHLRAHKERAS